LTKAIEKDRKYTNAVRLAFDSIAPLYDSWYQLPIGRYVWSVETEAVKALLPHQVNGIALEVGVGTGMALSVYQNDSLQIVGIDIAWQMLAVANRKSTITDNVHLVLSDGVELPFRKDSIDLTLGMTVIEFIANGDRLLQEIHRCLRPAGHVLLGVLTSTNLWAVDRRIRSFVQHDVFELAKFPSPWQVIQMLHRNGFSQVNYRGAVYAPPFSPTSCLQAFTLLDRRLGSRWLSRALGAFLVFHARCSIPI
jgi:ubiquinone/menaquinone biosynthesis C-methylase UbiE